MQKYDIFVKRRESLRRIVRLKSGGEIVDLTGFSAKSQVRENPDGGQLICEITCSIDTEENKIVLTLDPEITAGIPSGIYAWDLRVTTTGDIVRYYIGGKFQVLPSVTE